MHSGGNRWSQCSGIWPERQRIPLALRGLLLIIAAMLDIKLIREQPDFVRQRLATRGAGDEARIDELLKLDEQRRKLLAEVETLEGAAQPRVQGNRRVDGPEENRRGRGEKSGNARIWATGSPNWTSRRRKAKRRATN